MGHISRRNFLRVTAAVPLSAYVAKAHAVAAVGPQSLLVGSQTGTTSKGIYAYRFDPATGILSESGLAVETPSPTFLALAPNGRTVFAVNEIETYRGEKSGSVSSFGLDRQSLRLALINQVASRGAGPCHVAVDTTGGCVFAANYSGGSAASFRAAEDGRLSEAVSFLQYSGSGPNPERQASPHAHRVTVSPDNRFVMINDLGLDAIHSYRLDRSTAALSPNNAPEWRAPPGSGPRALQLHPNGKWAYCVCEMTSTVMLLRWNTVRGTLETTQETVLLPPGYTGVTGASDIVLDRSGRFAYVANRLDDFVATLRVSPSDGKLALVERTTTGGKTPRHLALDPTGRWLLLANQDSDDIAVIARDRRTGKLADRVARFPLARPQCLLFV